MTGTLEDILTMRKSGYTLREIAAQVGCSHTTVWTLLEQQHLANLPEPLQKLPVAPFDNHLPADGDTITELMDEVAALSCQLCDLTTEEIRERRREYKTARAEIKRRMDAGEHVMASFYVYSNLMRMCSHELESRGETF